MAYRGYQKNRAGTGYPAKCTAEPESSADRRGKFERTDGTGYL